MTQPALFGPPTAQLAGGRRVQPVPDPGDWVGYRRLLDQGTLVDLGGRPLTVVDCRVCGTHRIQSGITCPRQFRCPTCQRPPGSPCRRPSGHGLSEAFGGTHRTREDLAVGEDDRREAAGDDTVPAPWAAGQAQPITRTLPDSHDWVDLGGLSWEAQQLAIEPIADYDGDMTVMSLEGRA